MKSILPTARSNSLFSNFVYNKPTDVFIDERTIAYCIPVVRSVVRIATAITTINQPKKAPIDNLQKKKLIVDVIKWAATSLIVDIIPVSFIPFLGTIAAVAGLFALVATYYEIKPIVEFLTGANAIKNIQSLFVTEEPTSTVQ